MHSNKRKQLTDGKHGLGFNGDARIHQKWDALISVQANRTNFVMDPDYYFASAGANYWLKDNLAFALIYAHQ